jgi:predicted amidophosphoribosyltransferase
MSAILCPDCEEPIGTVERYCWNCDADVVAPVAALYPFADYLDDLLAEADDA